MFESLQLIILLLVSSVFLVALFKYLSLPPMIAYFVVGLVLGPNALGILQILNQAAILLNLVLYF